MLLDLVADGSQQRCSSRSQRAVAAYQSIFTMSGSSLMDLQVSQEVLGVPQSGDVIPSTDAST